MSNKATRILLKTGKVFGYIILGILGLFVIVWLVIQHPRVQTAITQKVTRSLSEKLGTTIRIAGVDIDFFKTVVLEGIYVEDQRQDTLLYADRLRVNLGVLSLANKTITANLVGLEGAVVNLYKAEGDTAFNYEFIPAAFASKDTVQDTTSAGWDFDLLEVNLNDIRFTFRDATQGNDLRLALNELDVDLQTLGLEEQYPRIDNFTINGLRAAFAQTAAEVDTLVAAAAETAQLDTLTNVARKAVADTLDRSFTPAEDTAQTAFNDSGWRLAVNELNIRNTDLRYNVTNTKPVAQGIDFQHLGIQNLLLEVSDIAVDSNDFALDVNNFSFRERSGFTLEQLALEFEADLPQANLQLSEFRTPYSELDNGITVLIPSIRDTDNLLQQLQLTARFGEDYLSTQDAAYFTDALKAYPGLQNRKLFLDGELSVRDGTARVDNLTAQFDDDNYVTLNAVVRDLENLNATYADISLVPLRTSTGFIRSLLPAGTLPPAFAQVGEINARAEVRGYLRDLTGNLNLQTSAGQIKADFTAGTDTSFQQQTFDARLNVNEVELARFLGPASKLGDVSLTAEVRGSRNGDVIRLPEANVNLQSLRYNGYTYRNIVLQGSYLDELAKAVVQANDPNLRATIEAAVNLRPAQPRFAVEADLREVDLLSLNLYADTITLRGNIQANLAGTDPNTMVGRVAVEDFQAQKPRKTYKLDSLVLTLDKRGPVRIINLGSNIMQAYAEGQFTLEELPLALNLFVKKYLTTYPVDLAQLKHPQTIRFDLRINPNPQIIEAFVPGLRIPEPITAEGFFDSDSSRLAFRAEVPQAGVGAQSVSDLVISAGTTEDKLGLQAAAAQVRVSDSTIIPEPSFRANIDEDNLRFGIRLASDEADTRLRLNGRFQIQKDSFIVSFLPSELFLKKQEWTLAESGRIIYAPNYLKVNDLTLVREGQRIAIEGSSRTALNLALDSISLADVFALLPSMGYTLDGTINGQAQVSNLFATPALQADIRIDSLQANERTIGNVQLLADRQANGWIDLKATVLGTYNDIRAEGRYNPGLETDNISLDILIAQIQLAQFNPFVNKYVDMQGNLKADLQLRGAVTDPNLTGQLTFVGPTTLIPKALGAPYTLTNQTIRFGNQTVQFDKFTLIDAEKRTAVLDGSVNYAELDNIMLDLNFRTDGFRFLNSSYGASDSFYGTATLAANLRILGPVNSLRVDGRLNTLEGTELNLPTYDTGGAEVSQVDYITFVDKSAPPPEVQGNKEEEEEAAAIGGFSLNARVSVTPDAKINILLDPLTNDRIEAAGAGDFDIRMTPQGDVFVYGVYTIEEGGYFMNLFGAVKKQFEVKEGSTITLNGPPEDALLDVTAIYEVETSYYDLLADGTESNEVLKAAQQEVPVQVLINIKGNAQALNIGFDLNILQEGTATTDVALEARLNEIRQNETELNKQVFGLIVLNRFISTQGLFVNSSAGGVNEAVNENIDKSLSALLSQQLNNLSEDYLGVEVSVDVESQNTDEGAVEGLGNRNVGLNLSKSLFNNRLSVSVGSSIGVNNNASNANSATGQNIIGDFTVAYRITPNGSMTLRFFRRNEQNQLAMGATTERIGASLAHSKSFDSIRDLFTSRSRKRKGAKEKKEADDQSGNKND